MHRHHFCIYTALSIYLWKYTAHLYSSTDIPVKAYISCYYASSSLLYLHSFTDIPVKVYSSCYMHRHHFCIHTALPIYLWKYTAHLYSLTDIPVKSYVSCYMHRHHFCIYIALPIYRWSIQLIYTAWPIHRRNHTSRATFIVITFVSIQLYLYTGVTIHLVLPCIIIPAIIISSIFFFVVAFIFININLVRNVYGSIWQVLKMRLSERSGGLWKHRTSSTTVT